MNSVIVVVSHILYLKQNEKRIKSWALYSFCFFENSLSLPSQLRAISKSSYGYDSLVMAKRLAKEATADFASPSSVVD